MPLDRLAIMSSMCIHDEIGGDSAALDAAMDAAIEQSLQDEEAGFEGEEGAYMEYLNALPFLLISYVCMINRRDNKE
jgi:hypothetical protein